MATICTKISSEDLHKEIVASTAPHLLQELNRASSLPIIRAQMLANRRKIFFSIAAYLELSKNMVTSKDWWDDDVHMMLSVSLDARSDMVRSSEGISRRTFSNNDPFSSISAANESPERLHAFSIMSKIMFKILVLRESIAVCNADDNDGDLAKAMTPRSLCSSCVRKLLTDSDVSDLKASTNAIPKSSVPKESFKSCIAEEYS